MEVLLLPLTTRSPASPMRHIPNGPSPPLVSVLVYLEAEVREVEKWVGAVAYLSSPEFTVRSSLISVGGGG